MKYLRDRVRWIMGLNDPPDKLALAFALGVFVAFTPTFGLHTLTGLLLAWMFRVNKLVTLIAAFVNNPWTIVPLYGFCLWLGITITGAEIDAPAIAWRDLTFSNAFLLLKPYLWPFVVGTLVAGVVAALCAYGFFYWAVSRYRKTLKT